MWNKAEENADALREAFEAAAERAAEEAEQATAEALARAERDHKGAGRFAFAGCFVFLLEATCQDSLEYVFFSQRVLHVSVIAGGYYETPRFVVLGGCYKASVARFEPAAPPQPCRHGAPAQAPRRSISRQPAVDPWARQLPVFGGLGPSSIKVERTRVCCLRGGEVMLAPGQSLYREELLWAKYRAALFFFLSFCREAGPRLGGSRCSCRGARPRRGTFRESRSGSVFCRASRGGIVGF